MADRMPIMLEGLRSDASRPSIRMDVLNEEWAQRNHSQSLSRLASRGGLAPQEAAAIIERRRYYDKKLSLDEALEVIFSAALRAQLAARDEEVKRLREAVAEVASVIENGRASDGWIVDRLSAALKS